jgi:L-fuconolactonase
MNPAKQVPSSQDSAPVENMVSRRDAIRAAVTSLAVVSSARPLSAAPLPAQDSAATTESAIPIVDTHQHLWDLKQLSLPWLSGAPEILSHSYGPAEYATATAGLGIAQAVYMEVDCAETDQAKEADSLIALCRAKSSPTVGAVISGRPASESFASYIRGYSRSPEIKGVRQVLHAPLATKGYCLQPQFITSMNLLGELGLSFDLCMRPGELSDGLALAKKCPKTRFVVDHCGNAQPDAFLPEKLRKSPAEHDAEQWKRDILALAECDNVICKISGVIAAAPKGVPYVESLQGIVNHCLNAFGPDRVVFGGDWPVCLLGGSYRDWVLTLRQIVAERPVSDQQKLWHANARRFYRIEA